MRILDAISIFGRAQAGMVNLVIDAGAKLCASLCCPDDPDRRPSDWANTGFVPTIPGMKILLANPRGFCAGVNMAIECVDQVLALKGAPIYVFHEIVHNRHVVEDFQRRGVTFVDHIHQVPEGGVVVYSAHGISPEVRRESKSRRLVEIDATCPLVTKVHIEDRKS